MDCNELGGGFKRAMSDLQIRGGGNLLGISQSGNIAAIGYDLYLDLLQKTVADLKAQAANDDGTSISDDLDPEVKLQLSSFIPEAYIPDISQRYITYRRIAALVNSPPEAQEDLKDELVDRYGQLPLETITLLRVIDLKRELASLRISKLEQGRDSIVFSFMDDTSLSPEMLLNYLQTYSTPKKCKPPKFTPDGRLVLFGELISVEHIFDTILGVLREFKDLVATV
jgi:transcription-repair coupling factor (superfamily II helicase)